MKVDWCIAALCVAGLAATPASAETLYDFSGSHGANPEAGLIFDAAGALHGTTNSGGSGNFGMIFKLTPPPAGQSVWTHSTLSTFSDDKGYFPTAGLIFDKEGALYGTTSVGGVVTVAGGGLGTVFEVPAVQ